MSQALVKLSLICCLRYTEVDFSTHEKFHCDKRIFFDKIFLKWLIIKLFRYLMSNITTPLKLIFLVCCHYSENYDKICWVKKIISLYFLEKIVNH